MNLLGSSAKFTIVKVFVFRDSAAPALAFQSSEEAIEFHNYLMRQSRRREQQ